MGRDRWTIWGEGDGSRQMIDEEKGMERFEADKVAAKALHGLGAVLWICACGRVRRAAWSRSVSDRFGSLAIQAPKYFRTLSWQKLHQYGDYVAEL